MSLFNFSGKKESFPPSTNSRITDSNGTDATGTKDIPEGLFVAQPSAIAERPAVSERSTPKDEPVVQFENNIAVLYKFMDQNHEKRGYDDALINPDSTHLNQNIEALKNDLHRLIRKVKVYYNDFIREIDFHIETRSRSGMIDTVDELRMKRSTAESHIQQVIEIEESAKDETGEGQGILISYTKGFKSGLTAISFHTVLNRAI